MTLDKIKNNFKIFKYKKKIQKTYTYKEKILTL